MTFGTGTPAAGSRRKRGRADLRRIVRRHQRTVQTAARTWQDLGEMQLAAAQTIAVRSVKIAAAAQNPALLGDPELSRMVTEKIDATLAVCAATVPQLAATAAHTARWLDSQARVWARGLASLGGEFSPASACFAWQHLAEGIALAHATYGTALLGSMAEFGKAALAPVHMAATANARRLFPY